MTLVRCCKTSRPTWRMRLGGLMWTRGVCMMRIRMMSGVAAIAPVTRWPQRWREGMKLLLQEQEQEQVLSLREVRRGPQTLPGSPVSRPT